MQSISHKQGDTFSASCVWTDSTSTAINLTGYTITSQVRVLSGVIFVDTLSVTITSAVNGAFTVSATPSATASWPVTTGQYNRMFCDIQFSKAGVVVSSETFEIIVVKEITQ
ncbi:hypothetical protein UFOVP59_67 [uncultured Caudovirales phage]|uniref:BppU N-terminal domain-containing protein n=1 Tax=uncultured Caudovirales phage TaxID=2100421 RepID=A0A6J5KV18_9CAUD|nr:hypothetical protein UFOVP59_67 [uncultured Caudovirales phage]CAB5220859.1 hypothetical protein UFOVP246_48 [uncultured Caudovirales phage]